MAEGTRLIEWNASPQTQLLERDTIFGRNVYLQVVQAIEELVVFIASFVIRDYRMEEEVEMLFRSPQQQLWRSQPSMYFINQIILPYCLFRSH